MTKVGEPKIFLIQPENLLTAWDKNIGLIKSATSTGRGKLELGDVKKLLLAGEFQLWLIASPSKVLAIVITEIINYPRKKICRIISLTGAGRKDWMHLKADIHKWAKEEIGCKGMEIYARKGWAKEKELSDYKQTHVLLERDL